MPYEIQQDGSDYIVVNKDTGDEKARHTEPDAKGKAERQVQLLRGLEHGMRKHGN